MKRSLLVVLAFLGLAALLPAADSTLSYTAGQSNGIRTIVIPRYNAEHCAKVGLGAGCTTAQLVAAGCVVQTVRTFVIDSCTIFTQDAAGESAYLKEAANQGVLAAYNRSIRNDNESYQAAECWRFKSLNQTQQDAECSLRALGPGCAGPCP